MQLTDEQKKEAKANYEDRLKVNRRGFLQSVTAAAGAGGVGLGAAYYGYKKIDKKLRVGIIGTGDEGNVLIGALNPDYIDVVAICDIRPSNIWRAFHGDWPSAGGQPARPGLLKVYGETKGWETEEDARKDVKVYTEGYDQLLADENVEAVIIALPLWLHAPCAIDAMLADKHVLTEKLMAHSVGECKEMARVAEDKKKILATGHQRHYSVLYANAVDTIKQNVIGDIHHIRAQWHRTADSWRPDMPTQDDMTYKKFDDAIRDAERKAKNGEITGKERDQRKTELSEKYPVLAKIRSFKGKLSKATGKEAEGWKKALTQLEKIQEDGGVPAAAYGYEKHVVDESGYVCTPFEELMRWRLWNRTGGGLMAELGSHQLDASGIFVSAQFEGHQKVNPISVTGVGGRHLYEPNRDIDDHVYCTFEYPGKGYFKDDKPASGEIADQNKKVVVTYSSINGNGYGGYGEVVMGTAGTLILEGEKDTYLIGGQKATAVKVEKDATQDTYATGGPTTVAAAVPTDDVSRGYTEEIEHWAWCIRNEKPDAIHCPPKVAMADAVIALTSNLAMDRMERIEFKKEWFDINSDEVPDGEPPKQAKDIKRSSFGMPQSAGATA